MFGKTGNAKLIISLNILFMLFAGANALGDPWSVSVLPPQITSAQLPNVLLVMDYSGSMQEPAYCAMPNFTGNYSAASVGYDDSTAYSNLSTFPTVNAWTYDYTQTYYGPFTSTSYYKYDDVNGWFYAIDPTTAPTDGKGTFATGVYGNILNWLTVSRIDGGRQALIGGFAVNSSGNECSDTDTDCYVRMQGARRVGSATIQIKPGTAAKTADPSQLYIRPSTWTSGDVATGISDTWKSSTASQALPYLDLVMTSMGQYGGTISGGAHTWTSNSSYYDLWTFTINVATKVDLSFSWDTSSTGTTYGCYLGIMSANTPGTWANSGAAKSTSTNTASVTLSANLSAGTYYVFAGPYKASSTGNFCSSTGCVCKTTGACDYALKANVTLQPVSPTTGIDSRTNQTAIVPTIGGIANARVRVKIASSQRRGAVQTTWSQARWGFMYFKASDSNADSSSRNGVLLVRCGELSDWSQFCGYMDGSKTSNGDPFPYGGTTTGEALDEAADYFSQKTCYGKGINSSLFTPLGQYDPYYTSYQKNGAYLPVPCRQSFVILMSDGVWNGSVDPINPAYAMHMTDLRTESTLPGKQNVSVFSLFAFNTPGTSDYTTGSNAMMWTAFFGGFTDLPSSTCKVGYPYPLTTNCTAGSGCTLPKLGGTCIGSSSSSNSGNVTFWNPTTKTGAFTATCQKWTSGLFTPDACCKEWNTRYDMYAAGDGLGQGVPDNYYDCRYASQLQVAIQGIVTRITQQTASSSAVATISQQTGEGDTIIRGVYEANPPSGWPQGNYLWFGHLENYWPNSQGQYGFELDTTDVLCKNIINNKGSSVANCWDAALSTSTVPKGPWPAPGSRNVFTMVNGTQTAFNTTNITAALLGVASSPTTVASGLVSWVLGTDGSLRSRTNTTANDGPYVLGDIIYSTPVIVGPPTLGAVSQNLKAILSNQEINVVSPNSAATAVGFQRNYLTWRQISATSHSNPDIKYRDKFAYVGGNDGMLHAFLVAQWDYTAKQYVTTGTGIGQEIWAYIPSNFLDQLHNIADPSYGESGSTTAIQHQFMVDLAPSAYTVFFDSQIRSDSSTPSTDQLKRHYPEDLAVEDRDYRRGAWRRRHIFRHRRHGSL